MGAQLCQETTQSRRFRSQIRGLFSRPPYCHRDRPDRGSTGTPARGALTVISGSHLSRRRGLGSGYTRVPGIPDSIIPRHCEQGPREGGSFQKPGEGIGTTSPGPSLSLPPGGGNVVAVWVVLLRWRTDLCTGHPQGVQRVHHPDFVFHRCPTVGPFDDISGVRVHRPPPTPLRPLSGCPLLPSSRFRTKLYDRVGNHRLGKSTRAYPSSKLTRRELRTQPL